MASPQQTIGRPRQFDEGKILDRVVELFWSRGATGTTTRVLETELGLTQSSIYNAFGSKNQLLIQAIDRYSARLDQTVVAPLDAEGAGVDVLLDFVDDVMDWISNPEHPGCLLLNMLGQYGVSDPAIVERACRYRQRLRSALARTLSNSGIDDAPARAELLLGSLMGLNISAYGGADERELIDLADSIRNQIVSWTST